MRAIYDCARFLTSFNYFEWVTQAKARGATSVVFDARRIKTTKWPLPVAVERFASILLPAPALSDLSCDVVLTSRVLAAIRPHVEDLWKRGYPPTVIVDDAPTPRDVPDGVRLAEPGGAALNAHVRSGGVVPRLRSVLPPGPYRYTVTLRRTQRAPNRNSDETVWREFAKRVGAHVIADYEDEPLHLHDRVALYAGAAMNFFCSNGPGIFCSLTTYPCMMFNTHHAAGSLRAEGIGWGEQYPWMIPGRQRAIWEEATVDSLERHFSHWLNTGGFLASV